MASLLDAIKSSTTQPVAPAPELGQTGSIRSLLAAKSGKADAGTTAPAQSAVQEQQAAAQTQQGMGQLAQQGQMQNIAAAGQQAGVEQQAKAQQAQFTEQQKSQSQQHAQQTADLLQQFTSGQKQLGAAQYQATTEQLGFNLRLQNEQYVTQLQKEGTTARLDQGNQFKLQAAKQAFSDQTNLLNNQQAFNQVVNADERTFQTELGQMDINYALQMAKLGAKQASATTAASGISGVVSGGVQAYGVFDSNKTQAANQQFSDFNK